MSQDKARERWDAMVKGTRVTNHQGAHGTVTRKTGGSYVWVQYDGGNRELREWWESLAPGDTWTHWESGMTAEQVREAQLASPLASVRARVPHCRAHLEARSDCAECERERL
jgi:hypothetical protein